MYSTYMKRGVIVFLPSIVVMFLLVLLPINTLAFGVSTPYIKDETLLVNPGKIYEYTVTLQNNGNEGYYVDINYSSTDNIASLESAEYYVPEYTYNTTFSFRLTVPEDAGIGDTYALEYSAKPRVNGSGTVSMGVEIKRGITIQVTDENTNANAKSINTEIKAIANQESKFWGIGKYVLLALIIIVVTGIVWMLWRISRKISSKISNEKNETKESPKEVTAPVVKEEPKPRAKYTISEAVSLEEVKKLLQNINDEAFEVSEIKHLFREKLSELTTNDIAHRMHNMTRKEIIKEIDKIKQT